MTPCIALGLLLASGVIVESVAPGSPAQKAGLEPGDRLVSWSQAAETGTFRTPFDLDDVEGERAPRGAVRLLAIRGDREVSTSLDAEGWGLMVRPELPESALAELQSARSAAAEGRHEEAARILAGLAPMAPDPGVASWLHVQSGHAWAAAKRWPEAQLEYEGALPGLAPREAATVWTTRALAYRDADAGTDAKAAYDEAMRLLLADGGEGLRFADTFRLSLYIKMEAARVQEAHHSVEIGQRLAPDSILQSRLLTAEGMWCYHGGDARCATRLTQSALAIVARKAPGSRMEVSGLINLGVYAEERGDYATAEDSLRKAITILERPGSDPYYASAALSNLGSVLGARGDPDSAQDVLERALAVGRDLPVLRSATPTILVNLGDIAAERGEVARAEEYYSRAVALVESVDVGWSQLIGPLDALGQLALARGDFDRAQSQFQRVRSLTGGRLAGVHFARNILGSGDVARARGNAEEAERLYQEVAKVARTDRPGTAGEAEALGRIAELRVAAGRMAEAAELYKEAVAALDVQRNRMGSGQEHGSSRLASFSRLYASYVQVLLSLGRPADAFSVVESSRARALLELLAQRDLGFARDIPPSLEQERRRIQAEYDRALSQLEALDAKSEAGAADALSARLRELQRDRLRLAAEIRKSAPGLAQIEDPRPLSVADARRTLDEGTLYLSFLVDEEKTVLFAIEPDGAEGDVRTFEIPIARKDLQERVAAFVALLQDRSSPPARINDAGEELYRLLLSPVEGRISSRSRLLISPDGPLQTLPFAALVARRGAQTRFLAELTPTHLIASATLYAELRQRRPSRKNAALSVAAFGDPRYPRDKRFGDEVALRSGVRGRSLEPLPGTRREVLEIERLYPKQVKAFLDKDATEENAKSIPRETRLVHFGCHAVLNSRFPLDSALVLSVPESPVEGRDNGMLQAWEIFEDVRLDADLVTLSACESGLGKDVGGEGLVGLTRAFQYAGARSVLASLWNVADDSTAELMAVFYRKLKEGKPKDQALQAAQVAMIGRGFSPFHWAAFQLTGDWR
jgi:CHAT domain-containing protein/Tfp pilus assembly protein PilF